MPLPHVHIHLKVPKLLHLPHTHPGEKFKRNFNRTAHLGHLSYYCMVFLESHSMYGYSAGLMFIITCVGLFLHEDVA